MPWLTFNFPHKNKYYYLKCKQGPGGDSFHRVVKDLTLRLSKKIFNWLWSWYVGNGVKEDCFKVFRESMPFQLFVSFYKNNMGIIFYQEWSSATPVWFLSYIYTHATCRLLYHNNIFFISRKRVPWSDWLPEPIRDCLLWSSTSKRIA